MKAKRLGLWFVTVAVSLIGVSCAGTEENADPRDKATRDKGEMRGRVEGGGGEEVGGQPEKRPAGKDPALRHHAPSWADDGVKRAPVDGEPHVVVVGTGEAGTKVDAVKEAVARGRGKLAEMQESRIVSEIDVYSRTRASLGATQKVEHDEAMRERIVVRAEANLRRLRTLETRAHKIDARTVRAWARVGVPERLLYPNDRLKVLRRKEASPGEFAALSRDYETEGLDELAEEALLDAFHSGGGGAAAAVRIAVFHERRGRTLRAVTWAMEAVRKAGDDPKLSDRREEALSILARLRDSLLPVKDLAASLVELARDQRDPSRFSASIRGRTPAGGGAQTITVGWRIRQERERHRVLKMWIDLADVTPAWFVQEESRDPDAPEKADTLVFDLPAASPDARILLWCVPLSSSAWRVVGEFVNHNLPLDGAPDPKDHLLLRDLLQILQEEGVLGAVVQIKR
jgi:hypothetical protein